MTTHSHARLMDFIYTRSICSYPPTIIIQYDIRKLIIRYAVILTPTLGCAKGKRMI
jgi:hypothetical protein